MLESHTKNVYYNEEKEDNETGGYYAFSVGSQLPKDAVKVGNFYKYVEKRRGKEGDIIKEFLVSIIPDMYCILFSSSPLFEHILRCTNMFLCFDQNSENRVRQTNTKISSTKTHLHI